MFRRSGDGLYVSSVIGIAGRDAVLLLLACERTFYAVVGTTFRKPTARFALQRRAATDWALMGGAVLCCGCRGLDALVCHAVGIVRHTLRRDHGISGVCPVCILFVAWYWAWSSRRGVVRCCSVVVAKVQGGGADKTRGRRTCSCS
ncbi:hypothetical protein TraAM80_10346 [Trypanosoma rangeli]|uniref:Uncharacterized protein n=1 Tax=Trypanosoma rangeli TaxID=5698 RepID=A0A3R7M2Z8_TRYRA|nr:uncharacterized protein TraAM80_10346 [Trypanosoma rangeli]RNE95202.1 hypothetical protein TraAM80_10346 [Trypanosoma rangeli]|eukprot:RNE95202.1 hypothetical protein TraAM80_10346 [Trypanosoma rangeli]